MRLWIAQGFGAGRIPFAPGTFGSVVGLGWFFLLVATGRCWAFLAGVALGICVSVWLCGYAEKVLRQKDPSSVVLDEIVAIPLCFCSWIGVHQWRTNLFPGVADFLGQKTWVATVAILAAFRLFDIWKPWPIRQSQQLPGGWGVTVDDLLAALGVAVVVLGIALWRG